MDPRLLVPSPLLSNLALRFQNKGYIAEKIFKTVEVPLEFGTYTVWDDDVIFRQFDDTMAKYGSANQIDVTGTKVDFTLETKALKAYIDPQELTQAGPTPVRAAKVDALMNAMKLNLEIRVAALLSNASYFTTGETLVSGASPASNIQWSDYTNSNPRKKVQDLKAAALMDFNTAVMSRRSANILLNHTDLKNSIIYTNVGFDTDKWLAQWLGVENILIGDALKSTNKKGQTLATTPVWGNDIILMHIAPGAPSALMDKPSVGYMPVANKGGGMWRVYTGRNPEVGTGEGAEMIKVESTYKPLISAPRLAYRLTAAVA